MKNKLTKLIQETVLSNDKQAREVAKAVGKPYATLMREINPGDSGAKVGVETLLPLMKAAGSIKPLTYLANTMGYVLVPLDVETSSDSEQSNLLALELMNGFGRYADSLKKALEKGEISEKDLEDARQSGYKAMTGIMTMIKFLEKKSAEEKKDSTLAMVS